MAESNKILATVDDGIGRFTINNAAKRNAMSRDMWARMGEVFEAWATDPAVRAIIVRGDGDKCFCAGNDISEFATIKSTKAGIEDYARITERAYHAVKTIEKPTIARIEGFCIGGGMELALLCDLQFAADTSTFGVTPAKLGLGYHLDDMTLLLEHVSPKAAKELLYTGRKFSAEDAMRWGLINRAVPADQLDDLVESYVAEISANAPLTVRASKIVIGEAMKEAAQRDREACQAAIDRCHESADYIEGQRAFAEKRKPNFKGI